MCVGVRVRVGGREKERIQKIQKKEKKEETFFSSFFVFFFSEKKIVIWS
jgi:hypothetical protein